MKACFNFKKDQKIDLLTNSYYQLLFYSLSGGDVLK